MASSGSPRRKRGLKERLAGLADNIGQFAEVVGNVVSSAGELLVDNDLRRKGANYLVQEAAKNVNEIQKGIEAGAETLQQGAKARFGAGAQRVTGLLRNIERQIQEFQKQQQQRDLQAELEHHHKLPVDIQIGAQVFEDMPQEMRSRFWYVLLERPDLTQALKKQHQDFSNQAQASVQATVSNTQPVAESLAIATAAAAESPVDLPVQAHNTHASPTATVGDVRDQQQQQQRRQIMGEADVDGHNEFSSNADTPFAAFNPSLDADNNNAIAQRSRAAAAIPATEQQQQQNSEARKEAIATGDPTRCTEDSVPDIDDLLSKQSTGVIVPLELPTAANGAPATSTTAGVDCSSSSSQEPMGASSTAQQNTAAAVSSPAAPSPWAQSSSAENANSISSSRSQEQPSAPNPWTQTAASAAAAGEQSSSGHDSSTSPAAAAAVSATSTADHPRTAGDDWELVPSDVPAAAVGTGQLEALESLRALVQQYAEEESVDTARVAQQNVFQAMLEVPWIPGEGTPQEIDPQGEYARLLAAGCGLVEDIILRDVARTFPEHPLFSAHLQGQQRLLRLLKAYAAADPEVGYCQGMAFAAGVLLMYLPEEPAFRLYHRLMTSGPNLRRLYLPGLEHLKMELSRFELLLATHYPQLHQHLLDAGLPALLYAAQWYMTTYSCPFPLHVAARVLDILLQSDSDAILSQLGLAVMGALQDKLLEMDDFEALITYLKVQPLSWPVHTHRQVFGEGLNSPATEAELKAAAAAVATEAARLGRFSSFSDRRLARQDTPGTRHELVPGVLGPRTAAAAAETGGSGGTAAADTQGDAGTSQQAEQLGETNQVISAPSHTAVHNNDQGTVSASGGEGLAQGRSAAGLDELDAAFLNLDLNMIMPLAASDNELDCAQ